MDRLWAPWRSSYVSAPGSPGGCFFCAAAGGAETALTVARDDATVTLLNRYPYNPGHVMVAPHGHVADLIAAGDAVAGAIMVAGRRALRALTAALGADAFNVGVNHGDAAGASIDHLHLHVVPRWAGDTNFMPVVGDTKVVPEQLEDTAERLRAAYEALA